jgi:hypothetical protein
MLKTNVAKITTKKSPRKRRNLLLKRARTHVKFLKICTKASRRSKKKTKKCKSTPRQFRSQLRRTVGRWSSSTPTATLKLKPSLFLTLCSVRCKNKISRCYHMHWSARIIFSFTLGVGKCGHFKPTLETGWRTFVDFSSNSQILSKDTLYQQM